MDCVKKQLLIQSTNYQHKPFPHVTLNQFTLQANSNIFIAFKFQSKKKKKTFCRALKILYKSVSVVVHVAL